MTSEKRHCLLVSAALVVVLLAIYWQVTSFDFVIIDDGDYARDNPHINSGLTVDNLKWVATASSAMTLAQSARDTNLVSEIGSRRQLYQCHVRSANK
jgi:hypothetical protein